MHLLFFSDVHGSADALAQLTGWIEKFTPDRLVCLGDLLYHGPRNGLFDGYDPRRAAATLNSWKDQLVTVRGNCDAEVDQMMLEFPALAEYALVETPEARFYLTHGHRTNEANPPPVPRGTVLALGHTHIFELKRTENGLVIFNPGSIALPKNGNPPSFGTFDGRSLAVRRLGDGGVLAELEV